MIDLPTETDPVTVIRSDALDLLRRLPEDTIDAIITDPPYCSGAATEAGRGSATHQGLRTETIANGRFEWFGADNMTTGGLLWLMRAVAVEADRCVKQSGSLIAFCDWRMALQLGPAMESAGFRLRNLLVWNKGSFGCGSGFRPQHELAVHLTRRAPEFHAADVGNVLDSKRVRSVDREHPAEKPLELIEDLIRVTVPPGGIVVDPFCGSGVVGNAAIRLGRRAILGDKDANYTPIAIQRAAKAMGNGLLEGFE